MDEKEYSFCYAYSLFCMPFMELVYKAQGIHREYFDPNVLQVSTLLSIKTGGCPENCAYCSQSAHYKTKAHKEDMLPVEEVVHVAKKAKESGVTRFCMGAAWRGPKDKDINTVVEMIRAVKALGLETCATLGLLKKHQAYALKDAGLDFYNHNIDSSREFYEKIITTRCFDDRLQTLQYVSEAGIQVCCGGILGMGETNEDRVKMLVVLANLNPQPTSVPINQLVHIKGTPLESQRPVDFLDFVRIVALARIMLPKSYVRLSAGRKDMSPEWQTLCFMAGANSVFYGEKLLTTENIQQDCDSDLFSRLGMQMGMQTGMRMLSPSSNNKGIEIGHGIHTEEKICQ